MKTLFLLLALAASIYAQQGNCPTESKYDRFEDKTTESCSAFFTSSEVDGPGGIGEVFTILPQVKYKGTIRNRPLAFSFQVVNSQLTTRRIATANLDTASKIFLLIDGQRLEIGIGRYIPARSGGSIIEIVEIPLPAEALSRLLMASTVEGRIGGREFQFAAPSLLAFQAYLKDTKELWKEQQVTRPRKRSR